MVRQWDDRISKKDAVSLDRSAKGPENTSSSNITLPPEELQTHLSDTESESEGMSALRARAHSLNGL